MTENEPEPMPPSDAETAPGTPRRRRWIGVLGAVLLVPAVVIAVLAVLLIGREIEAPDWVRSRLVAQLDQIADDVHVDIGTVHLQLGRDLHPRARIENLQFRDSNQQPIGQLRLVTALISPRGVVFDRTVLLQDVGVEGARLVVRRDMDGNVSLAFGNEGGLDKVPNIAALFDQLDRTFEQPELAAMERVVAEGLIVEYSDAKAGRTWTMDGGRIALDLAAGATTIDASLELLSGGADVTRFDVSYSRPDRQSAATIAATITDAQAADLATQSSMFSWLAAFDVPITTHLRTSFSADGELEPVNATVILENGESLPIPEVLPIAVQRAKAYLVYDPDIRSLNFDRVEISQPDGATITASGAAYIDGDDANGGRVIAQLGIDPFDIPAGTDGTAFSVPEMAADLRLSFDPIRVDLGQLVVVHGQSRAIVSGRAIAVAGNWDVAADVSVDQITAAELLELWPRDVASAARQFLNDRVKEAAVGPVNLALRQASGETAALHGQFEFSNATLEAYPDLPPLTRAGGIAVFDPDGLVVSLDRGGMSAKNAGRLNLAGSAVKLAFDAASLDPSLSLRVRGPTRAALTLLGRGGFLGNADWLANGADFGGAVDLDVSVPSTVGPPTYSATGLLTDFSTRQIVAGRLLNSQRLRLRATPNLLSVAGRVAHAGIGYDVDYAHETGSPAAVDIVGPLSAAALEAWSIPLPENTLDGQAQGQMSVTLVDNKPPVFRLQSNLRGMGIAMPSLGWRKRANATGQLKIDGVLGTIPKVDSFVLETSDLIAKGRLDMFQSGAVSRIYLDDFRIGGWFNGPLRVSMDDRSNVTGIQTGGGSFDLRRFLSSETGPAQAETQGTPISVVLDRVQITDTIAVTDVRGEVDVATGVSGKFEGLLNGGAAISGTLQPQNTQTAVRIQSRDAGGVIRSAGLVQTALGGDLDLILSPTGPAGQFDGALTITNIRLRDAPAIAALLDAVSVVGLIQQLDGNGLSFEEVEARFRLTPNQIILSRSSAIGPGLGVSLDGVYGLGNGALDLQGVISPFYLINGIGSLFTRKGEGLIGFNFNLRGTAEDPVVDVNPFSALTPGMFREIFRRPPPQVNQ